MAKKKLPSRKLLIIAFAIVLVDQLGVGILIPIIPLLFTDPSYAYHLPISTHTGYLLLGALTALYPLGQFFATPILGQLSDTFGRRPILAVSLLGTAFSYLLFAAGILLLNIPLLFLARILDGLTGGNVGVAQAAIADVSSDEERIRQFGLIGAANGIGFILGPLIGGVLSDPKLLHWFDATTPLWFAGIFSFVNMAAVLFFFPETLKIRTKKRIRLWQAFANITDAATGAARRHLYITSFLFQSGFAFIITFFGVFLISRFHFDQREIGYLFAYVGLVMVFTQIAINRPLSRRLSPQEVIPFALFIMSGMLVAIYFVSSTVLLYVLTAPAVMGAGLTLTNLTGLISNTSKDRQHGSVLGVNTSVQALAQAIPPIFAGVIAAVFAPTTPILFAAITIGIAALFFYVMCRNSINA